jgi:hypothetical protein
MVKINYKWEKRNQRLKGIRERSLNISTLMLSYRQTLKRIIHLRIISKIKRINLIVPSVMPLRRII